MRPTTILSLVALFTGARAACAQVRILGTANCPTPTARYSLNVPANPGRVLSIAQGPCVWLKPWTIQGIASKEGVGTRFIELNGSTAKLRILYVETMANGDALTWEEQGTSVMKGRMVQSAETKWSVLEGTGRFKGARGTGICSGVGQPDSSVTWRCRGTITLAKAK